MHADTGSGHGFPSLPAGSAEELTAAVEAGSGRRCFVAWFDPLSPEQARQALDAVLGTERPDRGLDVLRRGGLLEILLPEVFALVGFGEGIRHKDVWMHTRTVVRRTPPRLPLRWAALLHDIGKVPTRRFENGGQVTFIGHPEVGTRMLRRIRKRLPFADLEYERVRFLIAAHLRAAAYDETWTDSAVRRFARDSGDWLDDLLDLSRADITSKYEEKVRRGLRQIDLLAERIRIVTEVDARIPPLPKGLGTVLIERLGIAPGPGLGRLMRRLMDDVESGVLEAQREPGYYLEHLAHHRARFGLD
ncbi:MAG TPA: HD domain-containing protein [Polyangia bacterium]|nr:HD domain-containing protein [Polyangia bacterium]